MLLLGVVQLAATSLIIGLTLAISVPSFSVTGRKTETSGSTALVSKPSALHEYRSQHILVLEELLCGGKTISGLFDLRDAGNAFLVEDVSPNIIIP